MSKVYHIVEQKDKCAICRLEYSPEKLSQYACFKCKPVFVS
jgi:hypothetical protein